MKLQIEVLSQQLSDVNSSLPTDENLALYLSPLNLIEKTGEITPAFISTGHYEKDCCHAGIKTNCK